MPEDNLSQSAVSPVRRACTQKGDIAPRQGCNTADVLHDVLHG